VPFSLSLSLSLSRCRRRRSLVHPQPTVHPPGPSGGRASCRTATVRRPSICVRREWRALRGPPAVPRLRPSAISADAFPVVVERGPSWARDDGSGRCSERQVWFRECKDRAWRPDRCAAKRFHLLRQNVPQAARVCSSGWRQRSDEDHTLVGGWRLRGRRSTASGTLSPLLSGVRALVEGSAAPAVQRRSSRPRGQQSPGRSSLPTGSRQLRIWHILVSASVLTVGRAYHSEITSQTA
jgi:hypothetical protein